MSHEVMWTKVILETFIEEAALLVGKHWTERWINYAVVSAETSSGRPRLCNWTKWCIIHIRFACRTVCSWGKIMEEYRKVYVAVDVHVLPDGTMRPTRLEWLDGNRFTIDKARFVGPRASTKVGGRGLVYAVWINGRERILFNEDGRWFVEARVLRN
mgnify:CR=1 FL=1